MQEIIDPDRVRARMEALSLSQIETAKRAGLAVDYVRDILRGRIKEPSWSKVMRLAEALGCQARYLFGLDEEIVEPEPKLKHGMALLEARSLAVLRRLERGAWRLRSDDALAISPSSHFTVLPFWSAAFPNWLAIVTDEHADPLIPAGHLVHVVEYPDLDLYRSGDLVVVERHHEKADDLVEHVVQEIKWRDEMLGMVTSGVKRDDDLSAACDVLNTPTLPHRGSTPRPKILGKIVRAFKDTAEQMSVESLEGRD